ncbi:MAG: hypothetical protein Q9227_004801 [Pyrenula ochraceoflavens]
MTRHTGPKIVDKAQQTDTSTSRVNHQQADGLQVDTRHADAAPPPPTKIPQNAEAEFWTAIRQLREGREYQRLLYMARRADAEREDRIQPDEDTRPQSASWCEVFERVKLWIYTKTENPFYAVPMLIILSIYLGANFVLLAIFYCNMVHEGYYGELVVFSLLAIAVAFAMFVIENAFYLILGEPFHNVEPDCEDEEPECEDEELDCENMLPKTSMPTKLMAKDFEEKIVAPSEEFSARAVEDIGRELGQIASVLKSSLKKQQQKPETETADFLTNLNEFYDEQQSKTTTATHESMIEVLYGKQPETETQTQTDSGKDVLEYMNGKEFEAVPETPADFQEPIDDEHPETPTAEIVNDIIQSLDEQFKELDELDEAARSLEQCIRAFATAELE